MIDPADCFSRLGRSAVLWADDGLRRPTRLHDSTCRIEDGECTCRSPMDQLSVGSLVVVLEVRGEASMVSVAGYLPVWVESASLEPTTIPLSESTGAGAIPEDYLAWVTAGSEAPKGRVRRAPTGGGLVAIRADLALLKAEKTETEVKPWRWLGRVHQDGQSCALLVDPTVPLDQVLDVGPDQVRVVPLDGRDVRNVLLPLGDSRLKADG